jgi:LacI family transcriptional regulator
VRVANSKGAHDATAHLIAHGHHCIAFLGDRPALYTADERQRGYVRALHEAGLPVDLDISWRGQADPDQAAGALSAMLDLPEPPTAVFAGNNIIAVGVLSALRRRNALGKTAVVGFDDLDLATVVDPPLTVIDQDPESIGRIAAEEIFGWLGGAAPTRDVVVPVRLIERGSGEIPGPFRQ